MPRNSALDRLGRTRLVEQQWALRPVPGATGYYELRNNWYGVCLYGNGPYALVGGCDINDHREHWLLSEITPVVHTLQERASGGLLGSLPGRDQVFVGSFSTPKQRFWGI